MNYHDRPDGEYLVDIPKKQIAPAETWASLSTNQLLEVQTELTSRAWQFRNNEAISKALSRSLQQLQALISQKLLEGR